MKTSAQKKAQIGFDYVLPLADDHLRLAHSEILPDEQGPTRAAFLPSAYRFFAAHGDSRIERVMTDNHWSHTKSVDVAVAMTAVARGSQARAHEGTMHLQDGRGRALQPSPAVRVVLQPGLHQQRRTHRRPGALVRYLRR